MNRKTNAPEGRKSHYSAEGELSDFLGIKTVK